MTISISRRAFTLGTAGLAASTLLPRAAFAQGQMRTITTPLGTYDIPALPQRVVAIDSRIDLQPALALGLPVVGHAHSKPGAWVPVPEGIEFVGSIVNIEQVLALEPDLIICADYDPDSEYWPLNKLKSIAPVLPTNGEVHWRKSLNELAHWLGLEGAADAAVAEYDAQIAAIKARHGDKLRQKKVVGAQPDNGGLWVMNGTTMLHNLVLTDLGANFLEPAEGQKYENETQVTSENFATALAGIDGILLATTGTDEIDVLNKEPLWQRLPAVAAGAVVASNGNVNYGSIYSAKHLAGLYDELYAKIA